MAVELGFQEAMGTTTSRTPAGTGEPVGTGGAMLRPGVAELVEAETPELGAPDVALRGGTGGTVLVPTALDEGGEGDDGTTLEEESATAPAVLGAGARLTRATTSTTAPRITAPPAAQRRCIRFTADVPPVAPRDGRPTRRPARRSRRPPCTPGARLGR
jgi:hypothetical protein